MPLQRRADGTIYYVVGSSGAGKTSWVRGKVASAHRLLIWDGKGVDWGPRERCEVLASLHQLRSRALAGASMRVSVRVPVTRENFALFCKLAWIWGRHTPGVLVVDEVADVTTASKAPIEWGEIVRKIRTFGSDVYVTTQRPQECDKTAQGNAHVYHCGRMSDADDQLYVARRLLGSRAMLPDVAALGPLQWIERDVRTLEITRGRVGFRARRASRG